MTIKPTAPTLLPTDDFVTHHGQKSKTFAEPPLDGTLNLPMLVDWHGDKSATHTWAVYPLPDGSLQHVTWRHLQGAMHQVAKLIKQHLLYATVEREAPVVAVLANRDTMTYNATMAGILRAGCVAFLISPRNSLEGVVHLLKVSKTCLVLGSSDYTEKVLLDGVRARLGNQALIVEAPLFGDLFNLSNSDERQLLPPMCTPIDNNATSLIIHSSGTTSFPKPIPLSHLGVLQWTRIPLYGYHDMCGERVGIQSAPPFHGMGFFHCIAVPSASGCHIAAFEPLEPPIRPNPERVMAAWKATQITIGTGPPTNLVEWLKDSDAVEFLKTLKWTRVGGGPLPSPVGDTLVERGVRILNGWGTTEVGVLSNPGPQEHYGKDWEYISCTRNAQPIFEPRDEHGKVYEICFGCSPTHIPSVFNDEKNRIYRTSDLVELHPTREGFFKVVGRTDDQLMLSTGEKTNPGPMESIIRGHPAVKNAIYFGRGRFHNGVLIELGQPKKINTDAELSKMRNTVWEFVERGNAIAPTHSRIFKEMILFASPEKPFQMTPKGTVSRPRTLEAYETEIDAIYDAAEAASRSDLIMPDELDVPALQQYVRDLTQEVSGHELVQNVDLFTQGFDSLQATFVRHRITSALRERGLVTAQLPSNIVYQYPTVEKLAVALHTLITGTDLKPSLSSDQTVKMLEEAALAWSTKVSKHNGKMPLPESTVVVITGSTGTLGCYILDCLYRRSDVRKVYALNRAGKSSAKERQRDSLRDRGLNMAIVDDPRIVCLDAILERERLGLDKDVYDELCNSVTLIMHNAWRLDFNLSLPSFAPQLEATLNLVNLATASPYSVPPKIINASSISVISSHPTGWVKEDEADARNVAPTGYGQSKFVAERLLASVEGLPFVNARIGQLSGSRINGSWNATDWFPMILKSSETVKMLPAGEDAIAWLPVDLAARSMVELAYNTAALGTVHLVHSRPVPWSQMITHMSDSLDLPVVPFEQWISEVAKYDDLIANPVGKMLEVYKRKPIGANEKGREAFGIPRAYTERANAFSQTQNTMPQLDHTDYDAWLQYWRAHRFLK